MLSFSLVRYLPTHFSLQCKNVQKNCNKKPIIPIQPRRKYITSWLGTLSTYQYYPAAIKYNIQVPIYNSIQTMGYHLVGDKPPINITQIVLTFNSSINVKKSAIYLSVNIPLKSIPTHSFLLLLSLSFPILSFYFPFYLSLRHSVY